MSATLSAHGELLRHLDRRHRAWRRFMSSATKLAAIADPRTGGNETLCHNWGNAESRAAWAAGWRRWRAYAERSDEITRALMRRHVREGARQ